MSNKIIKISIVLIFMLFVTGLFNFCFALTSDNKLEETDYTVTSSISHNIVYTGNVTFNFIKLNLIFEKLSANNTDTDLSGLDMDKAFYILSDSKELYCLIPEQYNEEDEYNWYCDNQSDYGFRKAFGTSSKVTQHCFYYDFSINKWVFLKTANKFSFNNNHYILNDNIVPIYSKSADTSSEFIVYEPVLKPNIDMKVVQTGTRTGHVEFTKVNWDSPHMYYIKDSMDELTRLIAEEELSVIHNKVKYYDGPVDIEYGEHVLGLLFDSNGDLVFSEISDTVKIDYDSITDNEHKLHINKENENTYYLSIHGYQDGDYLKVSDIPNYDVLFPSKSKTLTSDSSTLEFNGLFIGQAYDTALGHKNRKVNLNKNGITYFYLYDKDNNLINSAVINSSNYYSGEEFNFDVELQFGSSLDDNLHLTSDEIRWVKVIPTIDVPSIDNYELYLRISDYGNVPYIQEEDRCIFATHDTNGNKHLGIDIGTNSNTNWYRIDDKIYDYFYINTLKNDSTFTFELQLRSGSGQIMQTKSFRVNLSTSNKVQGTVSSSTDGKDDTYIRNPNELSGNVSTSNKYDFGGLNDLSELDLQNNVNGLIDNSVGFFSLISTFLLLLPNWISALLYLFFFGIIIITLLRFIRGS